MSRDAQLNWGLLSAFDPGGGARVPPDLGRVWQLAGASLDLVVQPIERFELAGTLNQHPGHIQSDRAKADFPVIFALVVAGYSAAEPFRFRGQAVAGAALRAWARVYRPTGNPIDEWFFVPLLQAVDLAAEFLGAADETGLLRWVDGFASSGARFYDRRPAADTAQSNNWMSRGLLVRAMAATVVGDEPSRAAIPGLLRDFVGRNFVVRPSGVRDGRTFDFQQGDALLYHVADLFPLVELMLYTPDLVDESARAAILSGLEFLRPYFLRHREHVEFSHSLASFDRARREAGNPEFRTAPWDPADARVLFRLARAAFPEIRGWTEHIVDHAYDPPPETPRGHLR